MITDTYMVTGLSKHRYPSMQDKLYVHKFNEAPCVVEIRRDVSNMYDSRATGIWFEGVQIGWIPKAQNKEIAQVLDKGTKLVGYVTQHIKNKPGEPIWASVLEIKVVELTSKTTVLDEYNKFKWAEMAQTQNTTKKEETKMATKIVENNQSAAKTAAYLEGGRIAVNQITKLAAKNAPLMAKGYIETPWGKLVVANAAQMAAQQFRPNDQRLAKLTAAMVASAYQEVYQSFDIEKVIEEFIGNATIRGVLQNMDEKE